ncbi:hypothetical protein GYA49_05600 [Candidatus Beckwithbacteria bacterium]|nr:hypothetical protein [Candidatus Beckwithbacteria bacterium]
MKLTIKKLLDTLRFHLTLFWQTPKDYLYSFTYSGKRKIAIKPFSGHARKVACEIIAWAESTFPGTTVYFVGSTNLGIEGIGDVDLFMPCEPKNFNNIVPIIEAKFGLPTKTRPSYVEWKIDYKQVELEFTIIDPQSSFLKMQLEIFEKLQSNSKILAEYKNLKTSANHLSVRNYQLRKMEFFNRLLSS